MSERGLVLRPSGMKLPKMDDATFDRAMCGLMREGRVRAQCSRCKATLTHDEHARRSCRSCGRFDGTFEIKYTLAAPN